MIDYKPESFAGTRPNPSLTEGAAGHDNDVSLLLPKGYTQKKTDTYQKKIPCIGHVSGPAIHGAMYSYVFACIRMYSHVS